MASVRSTAAALLPLRDRSAEWDRRLAMIRQAKSFLYLSTYYLEYDDYGIELLAALSQAQGRGVAVNLLIDGYGQRLGGVLMSASSKAALSSQLDALRAAGGIATFYRPRYELQRRLGSGQHVKIQLSEAGEAIFGSSNITKSSFEAWSEYSVSLWGPVVPALLESYREIGGTVDAAHLRQAIDVAQSASADLELEYWLCNPSQLQGPLGPLGWPGPNSVTDRLVEMIDQARVSIAITSFYFKPVESLMGALIRAAKRGVQIEVHHSHRDALPATELAWLAAAVSYERLLEAEVRVYESLGGEHSKIVLVDGSWVAFGSYNFEEAAHDRLAEAMLASRDPRAIAPAAAIFEALRNEPHNVLVTPPGLRQWPARLKLKRTVLAPFKRWM